MPTRDTFALLPAWTPPALYGLALVSAGVFAVVLSRRLRGLELWSLIRGAPGWKSGAPVRRLLRLALQQRRVAARRRGVPHLLLVAGLAGLTVATALVAVDWDVARPLHTRLLSGAFERWFEAGADAFGVLLVVGLLAALVHGAIRRTARRSFAAVIAVLLLLAVGGFALEGLRLDLRPVEWSGWSFVGVRVARLVHGVAASRSPALEQKLYVVVWWSHALLAFALIAALPATSLLHAVTGPLTILVSREHPAALTAPFDLRELMASGRFDVKPGVSRRDEFPARDRLALLACTSCGRCDAVCPATTSGAPLAPSRLVATLRDDGAVPPESLWACTTCGACIEECPLLVRPGEMVVPLRRDLVARQQIDARQSQLLAALVRTSNPYGLPTADRGRLARELALPPPSRDRPDAWLLWIGCAAAYGERAGRVVAATVKVLRAAGVELVALGAEESCCGDAARRLGEEGLFQQLALANVERLRAAGVRRVVTHCAHCRHVLADEWRRFGFDAEVVHHSELIARALRDGRLRPSRDGVRTVALHDSCYLGRYARIFDAPREALAAVPSLRAVELPRRRERALCCGGGGARFWYDVAARETPAASRVREAVASGATTLAVGCPFCLATLSSAANESPAPLEVVDVAELVAAALPDEPSPESHA